MAGSTKRLKSKEMQVLCRLCVKYFVIMVTLPRLRACKQNKVPLELQSDDIHNKGQNKAAKLHFFTYKSFAPLLLCVSRSGKHSAVHEDAVASVDEWASAKIQGNKN